MRQAILADTRTWKTLWPEPETELLWDRLLRDACETLRSASPELIAAVSVSRALENGEAEALAVASLSEEIADEYGLGVAVYLSDKSLIVRLCRDSNEGSEGIVEP